MILAALLSMSLAAQSLPSLAGKRIAVFGFGLDRSIVREGTERDAGPGLLQKSDDYFKAQQAATDTLYAHFLASFGTLFKDLNVLPVDSVRNQPGYASNAECHPKKVFGREILGCNDLSPKGGLYAVSGAQNTDGLDALAKSMNLEYYVLFESSACYKMNGGAGINSLEAGVGKMKLETLMYLRKPGKGIVWMGRATELCKTMRPMVNSLYSSDNYVLVGEAFDALAPHLRQQLDKAQEAK